MSQTTSALVRARGRCVAWLSSRCHGGPDCHCAQTWDPKGREQIRLKVSTSRQETRP